MTRQGRFVSYRLVGEVNGSLIARTLHTILASGVADRVVVSTDDEEIASIARIAGADVPFVRPAELSDDRTPTAPVIAHSLHALAEMGDDNYDFVLVVYPAAVLLDANHLLSAKAMLVASPSAVVMTVGRHPAPIERAWRRTPAGHGEMVNQDQALTRTQDLAESFYDAGQLYFGCVDFWTGGGDIAASNPLLLILDRFHAVDIDTEDDLAFAERLFTIR
jgi:pseudaminic acid cytidylyltransferase